MYQLRGLALLRRNQAGDIQRAVTDLSAAIRYPRAERPLVPMLSRASAYHLRAAALMRTRDYPSACADCTAAIRLEPGEASYYVTRSFVNLTSRQYDATIADCNEGLRLDPSLAIFYQARGIAYNNKGDLAAAGDLAKFRQLQSAAGGPAPSPGP